MTNEPAGVRMSEEAPPPSTEDELRTLRARVEALERELAARDAPSRSPGDEAFRSALYEAMLYGLGRTISLYDPASVHVLVREMGRHIREYLEELGYDLGSASTPDEAVERIVQFFASHGFVDLEVVEEAGAVVHAVWRELLGLRAYERILATGGQTFVSCPLNAVLADALEAFGKTLVLRDKRFDLAGRFVETWEEIVDARGGPSSRSLSLDPERLLEVEREQSRQLRLRDEFIRIASHELATPLTSMKLALALFERSELPDGARHRLPGLRRQVARLDQLVSLMLDTTRLQIGRVDLRKTRVDLVTIARQALDLLEGDVPPAERRIRLDCVDPEIPGTWDASRIDQVVMNLLTNALKYGCDRPVDVRLVCRAGTARLTVSDRGIGIPDADKIRIFDPFERVASVERHYGGLGLGLFIVRKLVELHGGTVGVDSQLGCGSVFTVELPCGSEARPP